MSDLDLTNLVAACQMAELKVERAKQHISYLEHVIRWMLDPGNYVLTPERHPQSGQYQLLIGPRGGGLPAELPLAIGDAIHNLASVLDYLWSGLERQVDPTLNRRATFPRHETRENLVNLLASKTAIKQAFPQTESLILDVIKPYKAGNFSLWVLGKLNNVDKHRLLLVTYAISRFGKFVATSEDGGVVDLSHISVQTDGPYLSIGFATPFKLNDDAEVTAEVVFGETDLPPSQPVLQTLVNFTEATSEAIKAFREAFLGSPAPAA